MVSTAFNIPYYPSNTASVKRTDSVAFAAPKSDKPDCHADRQSLDEAITITYFQPNVAPKVKLYLVDL